MLARIGTAVAEKVHGRRRTGEGYLVVRDRYLFADQERALGWCYLGLPGAPIFLASVWYIAFKYGQPTAGSAIPTAHFASWAVMPADVQILTIVAIAGWASCFAAMFRLVVLSIAMKEQPLSDLD